MKMKNYIQPETTVMKLSLQEGVMQLSNTGIQKRTTETVEVSEAWGREEGEGFFWE